MTEVGRVTAIIDGDISALRSKLALARQESVSGVAGIESDLKGKLGSGLTGALSGGNWKNVGANLGQDLVQGITAPLGSMGGVASSVATTLGPAGIVATAAIAGAVMIGSAASGAAMEWEAGMSQISKTTGIVKGAADFEALNSGLKDLYSTMPTTVSEIQSVAAAAGSLGIEKASIAGFTEVALQMGSAFDIPAEQAATAIGKIKGQLKSLPEGANDSADFAMKFGSAVDYVGNNFNATEKDVLDFSTRTAGSLSALGGSAYEIAGWGGMLSSVFPSAERAAGSFDSLLTQLTTNTLSQKTAAELLGVSTDEFMQSMTTDPSGTILNIGKAMESLPTDKLMGVAKDLGGAYGMDTLVKMVGHTEEWGQAIEDTVQAGQKGESIGTSFAAGADNMKAGLQVLKNSVGAILTDMGGPINAAFAPVITAVAGGLNKVRAIGENLWGPITAGLAPLTGGISALIGTVGELGGMTLDGLVAGSEAINTTFKVGKAFVSAFKEELTKIVTSSSTFQTLSGYVDQASDAFGRLGDWAGETFDKIVSGLSDAIPTAITGVTGAIGTLMDKAGLGGVADAFSGVSGFLGDVYKNAMGKLGLDAGDAMGEGIKDSDKLKNAPGDALSSTQATAAALKSAQDLAKEWVAAYGSYFDAGMAKLAGGGFMSWDEINRRKIASAVGGNGQTDFEQSAYTATTNAGLDLAYEYQTDSFGQIGIIKTADGTILAKRQIKSRYDSGYEADVAALLRESGLVGNQGNILDITSSKGAGDVWRIKNSANIEIVTDAYFGFANNLKDEMSSAGEEINQALLDGLTPDKASIESRLESIRRLKLYDPEEAKAQGADNAIAYLGALQDSLDTYESAKATFLAEPDNEQAQAAFENALGNLQQVAEANPLKIKADTSDLYSEVFKALMQGQDWASMGVTNPQRFLQYSDEALKSQIGGYAKMGVAVPKDSETYQLLQNMQGVFHELESQGKLDSRNQLTSRLLDQALANPGGYQWENLYAWAGTLPATTQQAATNFNQGITQGTTQAARPIFDATGSFKIGVDESGRHIAVIGSQARTDGVAGGAGMRAGGQEGGSAVASGGHVAANALIGAAGSLANSLRYSNVPGGILDTGNIFGKLSGSANQYAAGLIPTTPETLSQYYQPAGTPYYPLAAPSQKASFYGTGSGLEGWGGTPKGYSSSLKSTGEATAQVNEQTEVLCAGMDDLSYSTYDTGCAISEFGQKQEETAGLFYESSIGLTNVYQGLSAAAGQLSNSFYPLAGSIGAVSGSSAGLSGLLQYTAESMNTWCEAASDFAYAQETTPGLFQPSYIGPSAGYTSPSGMPITHLGSFANEGYISAPMLAVVGDRPGGEYVVGAARFESALSRIESGSGRGGNSITVNVIVQGDVTGDGLVERITRQVEENIAYFFTKED